MQLGATHTTGLAHATAELYSSVVTAIANAYSFRPDHCDGTYDANCDDSRAYTNITQILQSFGKTDLLSYMQTYWPDYQGNDESFWEHEWGKHGTCISTLKPSCYDSYVPTQEVPDFFQRTVDLFKTLPSYQVNLPSDLSGLPPISLPFPLPFLAFTLLVPLIPATSRTTELGLTTCKVARRRRHHPLNNSNLHLRSNSSRPLATPWVQRHNRLLQRRAR